MVDLSECPGGLLALVLLAAGSTWRSGGLDAHVPADVLPFGTLLHDPSPTEWIYKHTANGPLRLFCFEAVGATAEGSCLAALWIHGGGWMGGTCESFFPLARYTAARGAASFVVEYRLANTNGTVTVRDCVADCQAAVRYLRGHAAALGIDPHRIAVIGESAGGHLAACVGTLDDFNDPADDLTISGRPDALVLYNPLTEFEPSSFEELLAHAPVAGRTERMRELSPALHVRAGQPPAICIHGLADVAVSPEHSRRFADAMRRVGNRCDLVLLADTPHAFLIPNYKCSEETVVDALLVGDRFLTSLGWFSGEPTLTVSDPPSWAPKWPPATQPK